METMQQSTSVVMPSDCKSMTAFGDEVTILLGPEQTGGLFTMFTGLVQPGGGPPPHVHAKEDEWFYVLEGKAEFLKEGVWHEAPVGTAVFTPKGVVHTFRNAGDVPLKMLMHTSPCGFEKFFSRCADEFAKPEGPDMGSIMAIAGEHGINFV